MNTVARIYLREIREDVYPDTYKDIHRTFNNSLRVKPAHVFINSANGYIMTVLQ